mgnify:CR=1 FL=1
MARLLVGDYMKKIIILLFVEVLIFFLFISCDNTENYSIDKAQVYNSNVESINDSKSDIKDNQQLEVINMPGCYHDLGWDDLNEFPSYENDVIPDAKTAVEVTTAIFNNMIKSEDRQDHIPVGVFYDEKLELWIVSYNEGSGNIIGGDCSIAIQKKDGRIERIWFGS